MNRYYVAMYNDEIPVDDVHYPTMTAAKEAIKRAYLSDIECGEVDAGSVDYFVECNEFHANSFGTFQDVYYKPYLNKSGSVSLRKVGVKDYSQNPTMSKIIRITI